MPKYISKINIEKVKLLRSQGWSLPEIYREVKIGYGSVSKYIQGVEILPQYKQLWLNKRKGSVVRMEKAEKEAYEKAKESVISLNKKEKLLLLAALYWGEGGKTDFNFTNSDPKMVGVFVSGLRDVLGIEQKEIRASIRIYEDLDKTACLEHWAKITNIPTKEFVNVDVLKGKKSGKLKYGLCRIRVRKGGNMLKYLLALNKRVSEIFLARPHSSTDRTRVS